MHQEPTIDVRVIGIIDETSRVKRFLLEGVSEELPAFSPGSHIITYVGDHNETFERRYSLTTYSHQGNVYEIVIQKNTSSTGGSIYWHDQVKVGKTLKISYPKKYFPLSFRAKKHIFYAGGIGITPFLSMMEYLKEKNIPFELHYTSKSKDDCPFYDEIHEKYIRETTFYFTKEKQERLHVEHLLEHRIGTHVYFCGPSQMVDAFASFAVKLGYPKGSLHYERFVMNTISDAKAFTVCVKDKQIYVPKTKSLLETLQENGNNVQSSCKIGRCGTCEVKVTEGEVEHLDAFYTEEEKGRNDVMLTCVSRAKSDRLRIDI
ncbi:PDR/VanB family oxidoreductase [Bacillus shivajii]|uniref:PDR/VanB family oxidoreductase n=1 Tax=Bacillus shivajii TaxID=1983719 RepID=UPI001CF94E59|nr:PDR/VanB family oxidoreductase [Bacillus shivajii]UCZ55161.1 PDR/VanB family oxidoreductase [Bacillus shivajii]